jgi:hypothetical protein
VTEERRRSPQEKKIRSYQRDGRNAYGEATGASRRGIRRRKHLVNKANRRATSQALGKADSEPAEESANAVRPKRWKKVSDVPLAGWIACQRKWRKDAPPIESPLVREAERRAGQSKRRRT